MTGLELIILLLIAWFLVYIRFPSLVWTLCYAVILLLASIYCGFSVGLIITLWVIFALVAIFANVTFLRVNFFSRPFFSHFKKILPPMSSTEKEALEAGDVWWEGDLFCGRPNWEKLHAIPAPTLTQEEQEFLDNETETLCSMLDDWKIVQEDCDMTPETWQFLKDNGFFGLVIDKKYGGKGFSALGHSTIVSKIATRSMSAAVNTMVPNSLGPGELLAHYGTEEQKDHYLPRLAKGVEVPCFALTSLDAGSDAGAMHDAGVVCKGQYQGEEVVGIRLNWSKRYITLAPVATVLGLAFKLYDPEKLMGQEENIGITVALLPTSHPGVEVGDRHYPMGLAFMNGPTYGKDVFIPLDFIIGGAAMAGKGWRMLMECLSIGRAISLPALSAATGRVNYLTTGIYAHLRKQFKVSLSSFEGVQEVLAKIAGGTYMMEASRRMTAGAVDLKVKPSVVSAIQKYHATEWARIVSDAALDINAGRGIQLGPRNYLAQQYIAMPIAITVEGANILTRNLIIFGQGAIRCHPYVLREMEAASDEKFGRGLKAFDKLLKSHIGYTASNIVRALTMGLTKAVFVKVPRRHGLSKYYRNITRMSNALALVSDFAMLILGGSLKRKERLSARLGDVLSNLYWATTVLKYYADCNHPEEDMPYIKWCLQTCLYNTQEAFYDFFANFKSRFVAKVLRCLIFPYGRCYQKPTDQLETEIVTAMVKPSTLRDRMIENVYAPNDEQDCVGRLTVAFNKWQACADIEKKIKVAIKSGNLQRHADVNEQAKMAVATATINAAEAEQLIAAQQAVQEAMEVDAFAPDYLANRMNTGS